MFQKKAVFCSAAAMLALAVACSDAPKSPASPSGTSPVNGEAAADGSTLKVTAPTPPVAGQRRTAAVADVRRRCFDRAIRRWIDCRPCPTRLKIKTTGGTTVCTGSRCCRRAARSRSAPSCTLAFDANHTWRMRAVLGTAVGPWSAAATFKSPLGGFISDNEVYDPLYNGHDRWRRPPTPRSSRMSASRLNWHTQPHHLRAADRTSRQASSRSWSRASTKATPATRPRSFSCRKASAISPTTTTA